LPIHCPLSSLDVIFISVLAVGLEAIRRFETSMSAPTSSNGIIAVLLVISKLLVRLPEKDVDESFVAKVHMNKRSSHGININIVFSHILY